MAAGAAKYAHCHPRPPTAYRTKAPWRGEISAPLDFAVRTAEIFTLDRELDRAILGPKEFAELWVDAVRSVAGPGGVFRSEDRVRRGHRPGRRAEHELGPLRRRAIVNLVRMYSDAPRFLPPWNVKLVQDLHGVLTQGLGLPGAPGAFRTGEDRDVDRRGRTIFAACPPERIGTELAGLLDWVDRRGSTLMPVIPAAVLLEGFHTIRPFPMGNGTVGRALAGLYLRSSGLPNSDLVLWAPTPDDDVDLVPRLILHAEASGSFTEWLDYVTDATVLAYRRSVSRWVGRPPPQGRALEEVALRLVVRARRAPGWFSAREAARWIGGRNEQTVGRHLNALVERGILESLGKTRGKRFRWVPTARVLPEVARRFGAGPETAQPAAPEIAPDPERAEHPDRAGSD